jgi:hypothetical protein
MSLVTHACDVIRRWSVIVVTLFRLDANRRLREPSS